jgi:RNA polymerase sigma-70 factor (ECF subfamily)
LQDIKEIIAGCIANERASQEKLYRSFYPALFCLCKKFFIDDHKALEAVNDGMLKVYRKITQYEEGKGEFFNWVYTIVRNTALDKLKGTVTDVSFNGQDMGTPSVQKNPLQQLEWKDIYALLDKLPPSTRTVFSLFYLEGYRITEISERLEVSEGTVKWHLSEGRRLIKPSIKKYFLW